MVWRYLTPSPALPASGEGVIPPPACGGTEGGKFLVRLHDLRITIKDEIGSIFIPASDSGTDAFLCYNGCNEPSLPLQDRRL
jgi:hypothetical protein